MMDDDLSPRRDNNIIQNNLVKRISTSSENDEGDMIVDDEITIRNPNRKINKEFHGQDNICYQQILDCRLREQRQMITPTREMEQEFGNGDKDSGPGPSTSRGDKRRVVTPAGTAEDRSKDMICQAELAKVRMLEVPGKDSIDSFRDKKGDNHVFSESELFHSVLVDKGYSVIGRNIDPLVKQRIIRGEFVDFACLLLRDRVLAQQDTRLELYMNNGQPGFRSVTDSEVTGSFYKWEQAFRVYSTIYTDAHPEKAKQLIQYNHIIYSASLTYMWNNVYAYDIDFRLHMSENPSRNWGIILYQAWVLHMKERVQTLNNRQDRSYSGTNSSSNNRKNGKTCWKYNRGKYTYGFNCKFEHRCGICDKYGHGAHLCQRGQGKDKETGERRDKKEYSGNGNGNSLKDRELYKKR